MTDNDNDNGGEWNPSSAEYIVEELDSLPYVHEASKIGSSGVSFVEKASKADSPKTFNTLAKRGWRVGEMVPTAKQNVWVVVPMEAQDD